MFIRCCDDSIDFMYMKLTYNVFCRVIRENVISINLFTILGHIGVRT
jgi:hypothetical protein